MPAHPTPPARSLLLASTSPRRRQLLRDCGFAFDVIKPAIDDAALCAPDDADPAAWAVQLATLKASHAHRQDTRPSTIVLAADTIVVKSNRIIGQPTFRDNARQILELLSNGSHQVITGVAIAVDDQLTTLVDAATVTLGALTTQDIQTYLASGDWQGKAGGYNLIERISAGWPIIYEGDPTTIMGLSMQKLTPVLLSLGLVTE